MKKSGCSYRAVGSIEFSLALLRKLRKAMSAVRKKKALTVPKISLPEFQPFSCPAEMVVRLRPPVTSQLHPTKWKAEENSSSDCSSEPALRRHPPGHLFDDGPEA